MKNQYFGDINDYRKYGLLRAILRSVTTQSHMLIAWMLTPDNFGNDGNKTDYLRSADRWRGYDPYLFDGLTELMKTNKREVALIEPTKLLGESKYFSDTTPDGSEKRDLWFKRLQKFAQEKQCDFVFLDPDNGLEVPSRRYGRKNSSKYLYWREVEALWKDGHSLLIYQHFPFERREVFVERILRRLKTETHSDSLVEAFMTPHVVFFLALHERHSNQLARIVEDVRKHWGDQIKLSTIRGR